MLAAEFRNSLSPIPKLSCQVSACPKKRIVLIPIFRCSAGELVSYARSAAWTFYSLLANTDATSQGVDVKLYVEETAADVVFPVLEENGIDSKTQVILFKWKHKDVCMLPQKLHTLSDDSLLDYEVVFVVDADVYAFRSVSGETLSLFQNILESNSLGILSIIRSHKNLEEYDISLYGLLWDIISFATHNLSHEHNHRLKKEIWNGAISSLSLKYPTPSPITWFFAFLPNRFRQEFPKFVDWFHDYGYFIHHSDEEVLRAATLLGHVKFDTNLAEKCNIRIGNTSEVAIIKEAYLGHDELTRQEYIEIFYKRILM